MTGNIGPSCREEPVFSLEKKVLQRLGRTSGRVEFHNESESLGWGGCDTCEYEFEAFSVTVDGVTVWPDEEVSGALGGVVGVDDEGVYEESTRTLVAPTQGAFFLWLSGMTAEQISDHYDSQ